MKVLIAEDDRTSRSILTAILKKWGYETLAVEDGMAALEALRGQDAPKLALIDWNMPEADGLEVCREVCRQETSNPAYIILLTANTGTGDIVRGLEAGASDYICKPYKNEELRARLQVGERILNLQAELNEAQGILAHQAMHDPLTNVYNRRAILDALNQELSRAERLGNTLSVAICDIDHFKRVNDTYGHQTGDEALRAFTRAVRMALRDTDYLGRWGGEEFMVLAPSIGGDGTNTLFERIRRNVEEIDLPVSDGVLGLTVSIGVAEDTAGKTADEATHAADEAMYEAKRAGRNRVCIAGEKNEQ